MVFAAGILLLFPELIAATLGLVGRLRAFPCAIAFVLAAPGVLMHGCGLMAADVVIRNVDG